MRSMQALSLALGVGMTLAGCVEQEPARPTEADWKAIKKNVLKAAPTPKYQVNADLEGKVVYVGLDIDKEPIVPGRPFTLTHYWQVKKAVPDWRIFVHLDGPKRKRFINADHKPIGGRYPASMWKVGEIIRDEHRVTLPADWSEPELQVLTGLWKGSLRLKPTGSQDGQNRIIAAKIPVTLGAKAKASAKAGRRLVATKTTGPMEIDGKLDEAVWAKTPSSGVFVDTISGVKGAVRTEAKAAWDDKYLYVAWDNTDSDVWSDLKKRDEKLWTQEAVELFIDADGDAGDYIELQVNPNGAAFDSYLPGYRRNDNAWNAGLQVGVDVRGTLNKRDDKDTGWSVELAVPWKDVQGRAAKKLTLPPKPGDSWRINMFRLDMPRGKPQVAVAWSPPLVGDFHKLDRFGELVFGDEKGQVPEGSAKADQVEIRAPGAPAKVLRVKTKASGGRVRLPAKVKPPVPATRAASPAKTTPAATPAKAGESATPVKPPVPNAPKAAQ